MYLHSKYNVTIIMTNHVLWPVQGTFLSYACSLPDSLLIASYWIFQSAIELFVHFIAFLVYSPYFTPLFLYYCNLFLTIVLINCIPSQNPHFLAFQAFMYEAHNMMLRHDFSACLASFFSLCAYAQSACNL